MQIRHLAKSHFDSVPLRFCVQLARNCRLRRGVEGEGGGKWGEREEEKALERARTFYKLRGWHSLKKGDC